MLKFSKKVMLTTFLASAALVGCEKKEVQEVKVVKMEDLMKVDIDTLKGALAKLINVDVKEISYNEEKEMFVMFGTDQISLKDLTQYYEHSN